MGFREPGSHDGRSARSQMASEDDPERLDHPKRTRKETGMKIKPKKKCSICGEPFRDDNLVFVYKEHVYAPEDFRVVCLICNPRIPEIADLAGYIGELDYGEESVNWYARDFED